MSLKGKVTVITGGASGMGEQCVRIFAARGAKVVFTDVNEQKAKALLESLTKEGLGKEVRYFKADISQESEVRGMADYVAKAFGDCEVLCNVAGIFIGGKIHEMSTEDWNKIFAVDVTAPYYCCKYFIPMMLKHKKGAVVNVSSISGIGGEYNMAGYCAAKGAVANMTRAMAMDYAAQGIRVNAICPGATKTPMFMTGTSPEVMKKFVDNFPPRRIGLPEEVAQAIAFLASDEASFINGVMLPVDGGISAWTGQPRQDKNEA